MDFHPHTGTALKKILHYPITVATGHTLQTYGDHTATSAIRCDRQPPQLHSCHWQLDTCPHLL